uniref:Uncharacterized protein n=1 Tax=Nothobranchius pienaari TaxID=704102 RepID=A0A1A8LGT4_9TELE
MNLVSNFFCSRAKNVFRRLQQLDSQSCFKMSPEKVTESPQKSSVSDINHVVPLCPEANHSGIKPRGAQSRKLPLKHTHPTKETTACCCKSLVLSPTPFEELKERI